MLTVAIILIVVLTLISVWAWARFLHDPTPDLHVTPVDEDLEIPDLTFDSRGMT